jgi:hypothetical protein
MKNNIICYNLGICPEGLSLTTILEISEKGYLIYDSTLVSKKHCLKNYPYVINKDKTFNKILVDISTEEGKEIYNKIKKEYDIKN